MSSPPTPPPTLMAETEDAIQKYGQDQKKLSEDTEAMIRECVRKEILEKDRKLKAEEKKSQQQARKIRKLESKLETFDRMKLSLAKVFINDVLEINWDGTNGSFKFEIKDGQVRGTPDRNTRGSVATGTTNLLNTMDENDTEEDISG